MDDSQGNHEHNMILGLDILSELLVYLFFSDNIIRGNGGTCEGCTAPMKEFTNMMSSAQSHDKTFHNKELWESEHVLDATQNTCHILDGHYKKSDLRKVASE